MAENYELQNPILQALLSPRPAHNTSTCMVLARNITCHRRSMLPSTYPYRARQTHPIMPSSSPKLAPEDARLPKVAPKWHPKFAAIIDPNWGSCAWEPFSGHLGPSWPFLGPSWGVLATKLPSNFAFGHLLHGRHTSSTRRIVHALLSPRPAHNTASCMLSARFATYHLRNMLLST